MCIKRTSNRSRERFKAPNNRSTKPESQRHRIISHHVLVSHARERERERVCERVCTLVRDLGRTLRIVDKIESREVGCLHLLLLGLLDLLDSGRQLALLLLLGCTLNTLDQLVVHLRVVCLTA